MWSMGVLLYILICGEPPFDAANNEELLTKIIEGDFLFQGKEWENMIDAKNLVYELMNYDPVDRIDASTALNHDFFRNIIMNNRMDRDVT
mmetsp:Transcript_27437/g.26509  ORF Transcript_27437/g.26509 Transcript_27437/m.26509 type:complete len:90 (-) Transcript_27437:583-852(-)